jgi:hypothetical protein
MRLPNLPPEQGLPLYSASLSRKLSKSRYGELTFPLARGILTA